MLYISCHNLNKNKQKVEDKQNMFKLSNFQNRDYWIKNVINFNKTIM